MRLTLKYGLPFVTAILTYCQKDAEVSYVLVDTGSARTAFAADVVAQMNDNSKTGGSGESWRISR